MGPERLQEVGSYLTWENMEKMIHPFAMPAEDFPPPSIPQGFSGYFSKSAAVLERLANLWPFHKYGNTNGKQYFLFHLVFPFSVVVCFLKLRFGNVFSKVLAKSIEESVVAIEFKKAALFVNYHSLILFPNSCQSLFILVNNGKFYNELQWPASTHSAKFLVNQPNCF